MNPHEIIAFAISAFFGEHDTPGDAATAVLEELDRAGLVLCRPMVEDHPVYPRTVYVPVPS